VQEVSGLRLTVPNLKVIVVVVASLTAMVAVAGVPKKESAVYAWMRKHHVANLCMAYEVKNFDPDQAKLLPGSGIPMLDAAVLKEIHDQGRTWSSIDGGPFPTYTKSPQRSTMEFQRNRLTDPVPLEPTDQNLDFGCRGVAHF